MAITQYFAMTGAEIHGCSALPPAVAWMACHFSPYGTGLSNLPRTLPEGAIVILNDRTPIHGHDPQRIAEQLAQTVAGLGSAGVLLDFQRPGEPETAAMAQVLVQSLPCPTAVSDLYAEALECPVFLPPAPVDTALSRHLAPWQGREIWLDTSLEGLVLTLTPDGAASAPLPCREAPEGGFQDHALHCHYRTHLTADQAQFTLWRTRQDLDALLQEAQALGIPYAIGLYQELAQPVHLVCTDEISR